MKAGCRDDVSPEPRHDDNEEEHNKTQQYQENIAHDLPDALAGYQFIPPSLKPQGLFVTLIEKLIRWR